MQNVVLPMRSLNIMVIVSIVGIVGLSLGVLHLIADISMGDDVRSAIIAGTIAPAIAGLIVIATKQLDRDGDD